MIAYGTNRQGKREILGFSAYRNESKATWTDFLKGLKKRGLCGIMMITSDAHEGIINAVNEVFPDVPWQRCQFHFLHESSLIRLMGSVLIEQNSISQARKSIFREEVYQKLLESNVREELHHIAEEQTVLLFA